MDRISIRDYHRLAMRTSPRDGHDKIDNGMLGLLGETGELVDLIKKFMYQSEAGTELPKDAIINELGDVLWYLEELADGKDSSMNLIGYSTFDHLDMITGRVEKLPPLRQEVLRLSDAAHEIRRAVSLGMDEELYSAMRHALLSAAWIARIAGSTIEETARRNIEKLKTRYPEGFDPKTSMARSRREYAAEGS